MKNYILFNFLFFAFSILSYAQPVPYVHLDYTYDGNGNRLTRDKQIILKKKNDSGSSNSNNANNNTTKDLMNCVVFPNPSSGSYQLKYSGKETSIEKNVEVYDKTGRLILQKSFLGAEQIIDLTLFSDGIYEMRVKCADDVKIFKILKVN